MVPFGNTGTEFVNKLSNLFNCCGTVSALECITLKAAMVTLALLLQHPHSQQHLPSCGGSNSSSSEATAQVFARLMIQGKVKTALCCLSNQSCGSFLPVAVSIRDSTVLEELIKKHLCPLPTKPASLVVTDATNYSSCHPVIFEQLDEHVICRTVLHLGGAAGPSGVDALGWHRLCSSFRAVSMDLCRSGLWLLKYFYLLCLSHCSSTSPQQLPDFP